MGDIECVLLAFVQSRPPTALQRKLLASRPKASEEAIRADLGAFVLDSDLQSEEPGNIQV